MVYVTYIESILHRRALRTVIIKLQGQASAMAWPRLEKARPEAAVDDDDGFEMLSCVLERARWNYERERENTTDWTVVLRFRSRREEGKGEAVLVQGSSCQDKTGTAKQADSWSSAVP
jgi:hypothetical protein